MSPTPDRYRKMLENLPDAFAYHQILTDGNGYPVDYIILDVNLAFEKMTGLIKEQIIGRKGKEVHPELAISEFDWVGIYGQVALTGETVCFEKYFKPADRWYNITAYSDEPGYFMVVFHDITQQKRLEEQLRTLADEHEKVFHSTQNALFLVEVVDINTFRYIRNNHSHEKTTGFTTDAIRGKTPRELVGEKTGTIITMNYSRCVQAKEPISYEETLNLPTGELTWLTTLTPVFSQGQIKYIVGSSQDITQYKHMEETLRVSQEHYRLLVDNANEAILIAQDGMHKFVNPMAVQLLGYSEQELLSKPIATFFHPEDCEMVKERHYRRLKGENVPQTYTFRIVRKNGLVRWVETNNVLVEWKGKPAALVFLMDISDRMKAEKALQQSEKKFRDLVEQTPDWVWEVDNQTKVFSYVSPGAKKLIGYEVEEVMGRSPFDFVIPEEREKTKQVFVSAVRRLEPLRFLQYNMSHKDGHTIAIETNGVPVFDEDGHLRAYRGINRDITERKILEEKLRYLSLHDQLTGLYSRNFFDEEMKRLSSSRAYPITIISADLDDLKLVNDTMGHESGDELLKACARVLQKALRSSDILARIGGDEFAAILPRTNSKTGEKIIDRIRFQIEQHGLEQQCQFPLSISLGLATTEKQGKTLKETLKEADDQMYQNKLHKGASTRSRIIQSLMDTRQERDFSEEGE